MTCSQWKRKKKVSHEKGRMGKLVKDNLLRILFSAGLFRAWKFRQQNRIIIITLHGVMDNKLSCKWTPLRPQVSIEWLERALSILSKEYRFVSLYDSREETSATL
jgi:hypothetical protein